jgi:Na+-driven multidrug efflux pump
MIRIHSNQKEIPEPNEHERNHSIWQELKNTLKGTDADYTKISLKRAIFLLAIPMILEMVMESAFAVVDIFFIGSLGASAVATVGLTETYLFLLYSIAMGLSMAVTAIIARRIGEKKQEGAGVTAVQAIILGIIGLNPVCHWWNFLLKRTAGINGC